MHCQEEKENFFEQEWGLKAYFSSFSGNSRGTAILFNNNFEYKIYKIEKDSNGNMLALDIEIQDLRFTLITVYGPNKDTPSFYTELSNTIQKFDNASIAMCGDWNLVMNQSLDTRNYRHDNNVKARAALINLCDDYGLGDPWRLKNPYSSLGMVRPISIV